MLFLPFKIVRTALHKPASNVDPFDNSPSAGERANSSNAQLMHFPVSSIPCPNVEPIPLNAQSLNHAISIDGGSAEFTHHRLPAHQEQKPWTTDHYSNATAHPGERTW
jgi:hypothetical protein